MYNKVSKLGRSIWKIKNNGALGDLLVGATALVKTKESKDKVKQN